MDNRKPNIFVISTQAPLKGLGSSADFRQGKTGQVIKRITGCEVFVMSDDPVDADMLKRNVRNNCWVVITGHGKEGGGFDGIVGATDEYRIDTKFLFEETLPVITKKYPIDKYVEILTHYGDLKRGDHINLVLLVCQAGKDKHAKKSFAEQLGSLLAEKGITSCIIANESDVSRVKDSSISEIKMQNKRVEGQVKIAEPPFVFMTNKDGETMKYQAPGDVSVTKEGIVQAGVSDCRVLYNQSYLRATDRYKKIDGLYSALDARMRAHCLLHGNYELNKVTFNMFLRSRQEVEASLSLNGVRFAFSATEKSLSSCRFSYMKDDGSIVHALIMPASFKQTFEEIDKKNLWICGAEEHGFGYMPFGMDDDSLDSQGSPSVSPGRDGFFGATMERVNSQPDMSDSDEVEKSSEVIKRPGDSE